VANKISIEIELDESGALKGFKDVEKKAGKSGKAAGDKFEKGLSSGFKGVGKQLAKIGSLFGSILTGATLAKSISAANAQADAVERLNKSLQASNDFSQQASEDLQNYAAELQKVTEFGDELIINNLALAKSFGATNEQAKKIAETATGLSKEFGISLESATRNVSKTLGGFAGELGEVIPELKNFTQEQLRSGQAIELLNARFGDSAKNIPTFTFAAKQLSNTFSDLLEEVGKLITESPEIRAGIVALTGVFDKAIGKVKTFASEFSFINDLLIPLSKFGDQIITFVVSPLELLGNVFNVAQGGLKTFVAAFVAGFGKLAGIAADFISFFSPDSGTAAALRTFQETSKEVFNEVSADAKASLDQVFDFPFSEKLSQKNEELRVGLQEQAEIIAEQAANTQGALDGTANAVVMSAEKANEGFFGLKVGFGDAGKSIQNQAQQVGATVRNSLGRGIANGISLLVNNLQKGKSAFADFGKFVFGVFGDLAIQLGQFFIVQGIAVEALKTISGAAAVAAGAALVALGTLLKSAAGGEGGSAAATAGTSGGAADTFAGGTTPGDGGAIATGEPAQEEQQVNQIIVQGDVFDSEETGLRLFDIISEQSEKNGNVIVGGAFA
jgi:hypothetical protein